jgi:hypothetical protein
MATTKTLPPWLEPFRADVEALARLEGQMPPKRQLREFKADLDELFDSENGATDEVWDVLTERWWKRFSEFEVRRARRSARLHLRLCDLYEELKSASDEEVAAYARLREQARISGAKQLWGDLFTQRTTPSDT